MNIDNILKKHMRNSQMSPDHYLFSGKEVKEIIKELQDQINLGKMNDFIKEYFNDTPHKI